MEFIKMAFVTVRSMVARMIEKKVKETIWSEFQMTVDVAKYM